MPDNSHIAEIRSRFPIFRRKVYLNSCSQGLLSDAVENGFKQYLDSWGEYGSPWDIWIENYEGARRLFARFIGARADEIAIIPSASAGINAIASALSFRPRNKVVMGEFEFPTMGHIWLAQAQRRGAKVQFVPAHRDEISLTDYEQAINDETIIVPLTHVCFKNGFRSSVEQIVQIAKEHGALVMLDDYQDCGTRPIDVKAMDVDFYVSGTLKYLLGPPGLAFMYVRQSLIHSLLPSVTGWFGQAEPFAFNPKLFEPAAEARRFEAGTPPVPSIYGACEGIRLLEEVGLNRVAEQVKGLTTALLQGTRKLGIRAKTPADSVGPLVVLQAQNADSLVQKFAESGVVVSSRHDGLRISFHVYNTLDDVQLVLRLLEENLELLVTTGLQGSMSGNTSK